VGEGEEEVLNQCDIDVAWLDLVLRLDSSAIYYTLSTIAQTLAGALAVLVAIVLSNTSRATDALHAGTSLDPAGKTAPSTKWWTRRRFVNQFSDANQRLAAERYYTATRLRPRLHHAIAFSLVDVAVCFAALPLTITLAENCSVAAAVLAVTSALGIVCLVLYWQLTITVIRLG
jgi:hypothetical protein